MGGRSQRTCKLEKQQKFDHSPSRAPLGWRGQGAESAEVHTYQRKKRSSSAPGILILILILVLIREAPGRGPIRRK